MIKEKLFQCDICGCLVKSLNRPVLGLICCDEEMIELKPETGDLASENHLPFPENLVEKQFRTGKHPHPMVKAHYIDFMQVVSDRYVFTQYFFPYDRIVFRLPLFFRGEVKLFSHCLIHGFFEYTYEI